MDATQEKIQEAYENIINEEQEAKMNEAKLTKQHFTALAGLMKNAKNLDALKEDLLGWLKTTNPAFNEDMFRKAAGM